jgi:hypothetical protein
MRLTELSIPHDREELSLELMVAGYSPLGSGDFADVYHKPGAAYVLKVFEPRDEAYRAFLTLARSHQDNPHFPKIIGKLVNIKNKWFAVRLEKLERYRYDSTLIYRYIRWRDERGKHDPQGMFAMELEDAFEFMEEYPKLQEACDLIIDNLLTQGGQSLAGHVPDFRQDIRNDNIMMRGNTIVIVDPIVPNKEMK